MTAVLGIAHPYSSRSTARPAALATLIAAGLMVTGCGMAGGPGSPPGGDAGGRGGAMALPVDMTTLTPKPVEQTGEFVGTVKSRRSTTIQPQAEGILTSISVKSGERVEPGKVLFEIDATPEKAALASLQAVRAARQADAQWAGQQAQRAKQLFDAGAGSKQEWEQTQAQQKAAEAQLGAVDEQIKQQQAQLAYFKVVAPTGGIVGDVPVRQGDRVTKTTKLTTVDDNAGLEVYVNVPVQQAGSVHAGQPLRILNEAGAVIVDERVDFVSSSVDDQTQTVLVKATLGEGRPQFRSDQFVRVKIVMNTAPSLTVPVVAVQRINGQYFAFVAEPDDKGVLHARQKPITVGPVVGNEYVLLTGLKAGDKLITGGLQKIGDGAPVQELPPSPKAGEPGPSRGRGGN